MTDTAGAARRTMLAAATLLLGGSMLTAAATAADTSSAISDLKQLNVEDLMNIEVMSVTRHPEKLLGAASAIQVVTQAEIRRAGATTLAEAVRLADNLQSAQRGSSGWAISSRGFNTDLGNKLLVMIDGRTVYTPLYSGVYWEAQDYLLEDIDRIEVISGPGGTLWGANAVNGVINIITRSAADTQGLYAEAGGGPEVQNLAGLRYGGTLGTDVHFRAYGKYLDHDDSELADGTPTGDSSRRAQGGFRVDAQPAAGSLTVQGDFYDVSNAVPTGGTTTMRGANLLGRWTRTLSDESDLSLQSYYDWTHLSDAVPALVLGGAQFAPAGQLKDDLQTIDLDFQHRFRLAAAHQIVWGLGFRHTHDVVANVEAVAFLPAVLDQQLYSAFLQDEMALGDKTSLTLGSKIEHNSYTGLEFEPSIRLQWQPAPSQTLWSAISRAVRTPSRIDRDLWQAAPPYLALLQGRSTFKSENLLAYEAGYRAQHGTGFTTSVAGFYNVYDDIRSTSITPATILPFYFANNLAGHTYGVEVTGNLQLTDRWSLHAGYNFLKERLHVKAGEFDLSNARNETADPEHQLSLRSSLSLPGRVELDAGLRWVDELQNNNGPDPGTVPSYVELDARLAWHVSEQLELSIVGQNLLHGSHPEYGFPEPGRAEVQRSVYGKLAWRH